MCCSLLCTSGTDVSDVMIQASTYLCEKKDKINKTVRGKMVKWQGVKGDEKCVNLEGDLCIEKKMSRCK